MAHSWTTKKRDQEKISAFDMYGLRHILRVSWPAKCTNQWVLEKARVSRCLLETVKKRKLAYFGHSTRKYDSLEKDNTLELYH